MHFHELISNQITQANVVRKMKGERGRERDGGMGIHDENEVVRYRSERGRFSMGGNTNK